MKAFITDRTVTKANAGFISVDIPSTNHMKGRFGVSRHVRRLGIERLRKGAKMGNMYSIQKHQTVMAIMLSLDS